MVPLVLGISLALWLLALCGSLLIVVVLALIAPTGLVMVVVLVTFAVLISPRSIVSAAATAATTIVIATLVVIRSLRLLPTFVARVVAAALGGRTVLGLGARRIVVLLLLVRLRRVGVIFHCSG